MTLMMTLMVTALGVYPGTSHSLGEPSASEPRPRPSDFDWPHSLADDEGFLSTYPDSHELSVHLVIVVAGTADPHPQESTMGNEGSNSQTVGRT